MGDGRGQALHGLLLAGREARELAHGALQLVGLNAVGLAVERVDRGDVLQRALPALEVGRRLVDELGGRLGRAQALVLVAVGHVAQLVDVVAAHVGDVAHRRVDVARKGHVDAQQRPLGAALHDRGQALAPHQAALRRRGREHHVGLLQAGVHLVEGAGAEAVLAGQPLRLFQRAVRHHGHRHVLRHEVLHGQLAHLARAQDEHPLVRDAAQLPRGQLHGNAPDGGGVAADARLGAHLLAQRQRALEPHVDHLVVCPRLAGGPVGTRHLAGYLRLAHDERV